MNEQLTHDDLVSMYLDAIPYAPYPVQEEALLTWFSNEQGILVCAPTGTGKTLIAEAAMFEALHTGKTAYYTTPLIALTEQKFEELKEATVRWGFSSDDVGLVTGNRQVNPSAPIKVVVAEILLNRLLNREFDFTDVSSVVMDEFHSFNDPERGVVWELSLALLPPHVRLMLLSATVGNAVDFLMWLKREHNRTVRLIQGSERKVPLEFNWVDDDILPDFVEQMRDGTEETRRTPALIFCFNRAECWNVAEQLKGKKVVGEAQQKALVERIKDWDWKIGAGGKIKQLLMRGVGVHHAGMLPKYRRRVEKLYQEKLLSVCICTETLAAGINLPARSVVMTTLVKGPPNRKKVIDPSSAHQIFGRAGRPQFDDRGYVFSLAHEDDVKLRRWKEQYDQIPEDTKDPNLIRMKKRLKKKMPKRRENVTYWNEDQFKKLIDAPPAHLASRGNLPWRLLAYMLEASPDVTRLRAFVQKRLMTPPQLEKADQRLTKMLLTLYTGGFVDLSPAPPEQFERVQRDWPVPEDLSAPPKPVEAESFGAGVLEDEQVVEAKPDAEPAETPSMGTFGMLLQEALGSEESEAKQKDKAQPKSEPIEKEEYAPTTATPTELLDQLLVFRSCHPLYGSFLLDHLGLADRCERIQILESVLEVPGSIIHQVRVPPPEEMPPGPLAAHRIDPELLSRGLLTQSDLDPDSVEPETDNFGKPIRKWAKPLGDKLKILFDNEYPGVHDARVRAVWIAGDLINSGSDYQKYITTRDLTKQEGVIFRHLLRMILLCNEFMQVVPRGLTEQEWHEELIFIRDELTATCRFVDPESTDKALEDQAATLAMRQ